MWFKAGTYTKCSLILISPSNLQNLPALGMRSAHPALVSSWWHETLSWSISLWAQWLHVDIHLPWSLYLFFLLKSSWSELCSKPSLWEVDPLVWAKFFGYRYAINLVAIPSSFHHFDGVYNIQRVSSSWTWGHCCWTMSSVVSTMILPCILLSSFALMLQTTRLQFFEVAWFKSGWRVSLSRIRFYHCLGLLPFQHGWSHVDKMLGYIWSLTTHWLVGALYVSTCTLEDLELIVHRKTWSSYGYTAWRQGDHGVK